MLQNNPATTKPKRARKPSPLDVIEAAMEPCTDKAFMNWLKKLSRQGDTAGIVSLYDACIAADGAILGIHNRPSCPEEASLYLDDMMNDMLARAFTAANALKRLPIPSEDYEREAYARVLSDCALRMGHDLNAAANIVTYLKQKTGRI